MGTIDENEMLHNIYEKSGTSNLMYVMNPTIYRLELPQDNFTVKIVQMQVNGFIKKNYPKSVMFAFCMVTVVPVICCVRGKQ